MFYTISSIKFKEKNMFVVHISLGKKATCCIWELSSKCSHCVLLQIPIRITSSNLFGEKNIKNIHLQLFLIQNLFDPNKKKLTGPIFPS